MKTTLITIQLLLATALFGQTDNLETPMPTAEVEMDDELMEVVENTTTKKTGDVITKTNGKTIRVNVIKYGFQNVQCTKFGDKSGDVYYYSRSEIKSIEWDGIVQTKVGGVYGDYKVVGMSEEEAQRALGNGKNLITAGLVNGAIGLAGCALMAGYALNAHQSEVAFGVGFGVAVFGSRAWFPSFIAGGANLIKTKRNHLEPYKESEAITAQ